MIDNLNRAFMYGESVFTTMRCVNGVLQDWPKHFERLCKGVEFVYGPFLESEDWPQLFKERLENKLSTCKETVVIRLAIYMDGGRGLLRTSPISVQNLKLELTTGSAPGSQKTFKLRSCPALARPEWWPSFLKAGSYLDTILAQRLFLRPGEDDLLFVSREGRVLESSVANIFILKKNVLFTAPSGPNVLEGIMRANVLNVARDYFDECRQENFLFNELRNADAVFGTNSVRGLFLVDRIDEYEITYSEEFMEKFRKLSARVFG